MFHKNEFEIKETWVQRNGSVENQQHKSVLADTPKVPQTTKSEQKSSNQNLLAKPPRKQLESPHILQNKPSSILNQVAKNLVGGTPKVNPAHLQMDDDFTKRLIKGMQNDGSSDNLFQKRISTQQNSINKVQSDQIGGEYLGQKRGSRCSSGTGAQDNDLLASMAARLQRTEMLVKNQREEIKEKTIEIEALKTEVSIYKQSKDSEKFAEEMRRIQAENVMFMQKMQAMEKFLADYGMRWKVDENSGKEVLGGNLDKERMQSDSKKAKYNYPIPSEIDSNAILRRIDELNIIIEKEGGTQEVYKDERGFNRIRKVDPLPIGFYRNGIALTGFKFFKFGSPEARSILADILEGYFPYQLKRTYPNGVPLKVIDKSDEDFNPEKKGTKMADLTTVDEDKLKPMSKQEFLEKLPKQVVRNGVLIEVRSEVQKKLDGVSQPPTIEPRHSRHHHQLDPITEASSNALESTSLVERKHILVQLVPHEVLEDGSIRVLTQEYKTSLKSSQNTTNFAELKVRTTRNGQNILVYITIEANKLIRDVYRILDNFSDFFDYQLVTNYPKKVILRDSTQTLKELELFPNSVLNVLELK